MTIITYEVTVAGDGEFKAVGKYTSEELPAAIRTARAWKKSQPSTVSLLRIETTKIDF